MNRAQAADALARLTAFWSSLLAEADAEAQSAREEAVQLRHALAQASAANEALLASSTREACGLADKVQAARSELADYERTVAKLRADLEAEQARRASYQAVDAAARRYVELLERNPGATERYEALRDAVFATPRA